MERISLGGVIQHSDDDGDFPYGDWTTPYRSLAGRDALLAAHGEGPLPSQDYLANGRRLDRVARHTLSVLASS